MYTSNGTWCDTINVSSSDVVKLPSTMKPEDLAALPSLVSAYTLLNNFKSSKIYQLNGDSTYGIYSLTHSIACLLTRCFFLGKDITMVGKALGVEVVNATVADLEKITDMALLFAPTSAVQNSKGITKPLGMNGKIVVYNDATSAAGSYGNNEFTNSPISFLTHYLCI